MAVKYHQISLKYTFSDCQDLFLDDAPSLFQILSDHFDLDQFISAGFLTALTVPLGAPALIPYMVSSLLLSFRRFFYPYRFPSPSFPASVQRTQGFLRFFQSVRRFSPVTLYT